MTPAAGASPDFQLLVPGLGDAYQIYWNGLEVGHLRHMPPQVQGIIGGPAPIYNLGQARKGVLAVRVQGFPSVPKAKGKLVEFPAFVPPRRVIENARIFPFGFGTC